MNRLTAAQSAMLFDQIAEPTDAGNNVVASVIVASVASASAYRSAWEDALRRHPVLKSRIVAHDSGFRFQTTDRSMSVDVAQVPDVFILTRVCEAFARGLSVDDAVRQGVVRSAPPVTAAAAVMVVIFAMFTLLPTPEMKQLGIGLAAAIALDATVVRGILVPDALRLLGASVWKRSLAGAGHH
ncbi:MMPL family transporter [Rhodococcus fascians]|nr:MMPL family transporter [Rhodococcus fascians]MBY4419145.1 MMPL family transporter [Rhodococcus fascians]